MVTNNTGTDDEFEEDDVATNTYQDDLDTNDNIHDPLMDEMTDDPTVELGVDPNEFKKELDLYDTEDDAEDDRREDIEDRDEEL